MTWVLEYLIFCSLKILPAMRMIGELHNINKIMSMINHLAERCIADIAITSLVIESQLVLPITR